MDNINQLPLEFNRLSPQEQYLLDQVKSLEYYINTIREKVNQFNRDLNWKNNQADHINRLKKLCVAEFSPFFTKVDKENFFKALHASLNAYQNEDYDPEKTLNLQHQYIIEHLFAFPRLTRAQSNRILEIHTQQFYLIGQKCKDKSEVLNTEHETFPHIERLKSELDHLNYYTHQTSLFINKRPSKTGFNSYADVYNAVIELLNFLIIKTQRLRNGILSQCNDLHSLSTSLSSQQKFKRLIMELKTLFTAFEYAFKIQYNQLIYYFGTVDAQYLQTAQFSQSYIEKLESHKSNIERSIHPLPNPTRWFIYTSADADRVAAGVQDAFERECYRINVNNTALWKPYEPESISNQKRILPSIKERMAIAAILNEEGDQVQEGYSNKP
jgi:hypothetical protein